VRNELDSLTVHWCIHSPGHLRKSVWPLFLGSRESSFSQRQNTCG